ncbi:MAG: hypothetical protein EA368_07470 [Leptolyngbya sp. DLM2.Bin27]|nr:MAG: hypothetical protein EA368_07470 [Leptolyngbya sp. DLM2.Bin27]
MHSAALVWPEKFRLGITLLTAFRSWVSLNLLLFGDILSIGNSDVWQNVAIAVLMLAGVGLYYKELLFFTFAPPQG